MGLKVHKIEFEYYQKLKKSFVQGLFYISSGVENILKTYFVFGALTKGFQKGPKSYFLVKNR